jgi:ribonuclease P/MRP protein subunit POP1
LHEVLHLIDDLDQPSEASQLWNDLKYLRTPASLPAGVIVSLSVKDPRMSFPPKMPPRADHIPDAVTKRINELMSNWPVNVSQSELWDKSYRTILADSKPKDADINQVRTSIEGASEILKFPKWKANIIKTLKVPVLLVQRQQYTNEPLKYNQEFVAGWDLILPSSYAVQFWKSLTFAGARVGGVEDVHSFHFESGLPSFPQDYPETNAYLSWAARIKDQEQTAWEKRPKAKRINYEKLGVKSPFVSLFYHLIGKNEDVEMSDVDELPLAPKEGVLLPMECRPVPVLHSKKAINMLKEKFGVEGNLASLSSSLKFLNVPINIDEVFVRVRITCMGRGSPSDRAFIYVATDEEQRFWIEHMEKNKERDMDDDEDWEKWALNEPAASAEELAAKVRDRYPSDKSVIGYVTTGHFALAVGRGMAIGCCTLKGLFEIAQGGIR